MLNKKLFVFMLELLQSYQLENECSHIGLLWFIVHRINSYVGRSISFHLSVAERIISGWIMGSKL